MRGLVLHRASPELNICCANISWVRFYKIGSGRPGKARLMVLTRAHTQTSLRCLRKLECVARDVPTIAGRTKKPGAALRPGTCLEGG
jgi:hypothetical protein